MMAAYVETGATTAVTRRVVMFEGDFIATAPHANYDVGPGAREFVMIAPAAGIGSQLVMIQNWVAEFRARIAAQKAVR